MKISTILICIILFSTAFSVEGKIDYNGHDEKSLKLFNISNDIPNIDLSLITKNNFDLDIINIQGGRGLYFSIINHSPAHVTSKKGEESLNIRKRRKTK